LNEGVNMNYIQTGAVTIRQISYRELREIFDHVEIRTMDLRKPKIIIRE